MERLLVEKMANDLVTECLYDIRASLLNLRDEIMKTGLKLEAIEINNWPGFDKDDVYVKLWNGKNLICGASGNGSTDMTPSDVIALVKKRKILMRRFNGI